jgi:transposase
MIFQPSYDLLLAEALAVPAKSGRSKLERYRATICELRRKGWTFAQIANWLKERGVGATTSNVHRFFCKVKYDYAASLN